MTPRWPHDSGPWRDKPVTTKPRFPKSASSSESNNVSNDTDSKPSTSSDGSDRKVEFVMCPRRKFLKAVAKTIADRADQLQPIGHMRSYIWVF